MASVILTVGLSPAPVTPSVEGQTVTVVITAADADTNAPVDPTGLSLWVRSPQSPVPVTYDQAQMTEAATGRWTFDIVMDVPGRWRFRAECEGPRPATREISVTADVSRIISATPLGALLATPEGDVIATPDARSITAQRIDRLREFGADELSGLRLVAARDAEGGQVAYATLREDAESRGAEAGASAGAAAGEAAGEVAGAAGAAPFTAAAELARDQAQAAADTTAASVTHAAFQRVTLTALQAVIGVSEGQLGVVYGVGTDRGQYRYLSGAWVRESDTLPGVEARLIEQELPDKTLASLTFEETPEMAEKPLIPLAIDELSQRTVIGSDRAGYIDLRLQRPAAMRVRESELDAAQVFDRMPRESDDGTRGYVTGNIWNSGGGAIYRLDDALTGRWRRAPVDPYIIAGARAVTPLPGDAIYGSVPIIAIGLHRLRRSYNGPCVRLRRDSDLAEMDLALLGNDEPDYQPAGIWAAGAKVRIILAYNQGSGPNLPWTGTDPPVLSISPQVGGWHGAVMENALPYNSDYLPRQGFAIPAGVTGATTALSIFVLKSSVHSHSNCPLVEFATPGGTFAYGKRDSSGYNGPWVQQDAAVVGTTPYAPTLAAEVWGISSGTGGLTFYTHDMPPQTVAARATTTFAGGQIGLTTSAFMSGGNKQEGDSTIGAVIVHGKAITHNEALLLQTSFIRHADIRPQSRVNMLFHGDSIVRGAGATYYDTLATRISRAMAVPVRPYNYGLSGQTAAGIAGDVSEIAFGIDPAALINLVYLSIGTNDLGGGATGLATFNSIASIVSQMKALASNVVVVVSSVRPRTLYQPGQPLEAAWLDINSRLLAGWQGMGAAAFVNFGLHPILGDPMIASNTNYYLDGTHQTDLSRQIEADFTAPQIDAVLATLGIY